MYKWKIKMTKSRSKQNENALLKKIKGISSKHNERKKIERHNSSDHKSLKPQNTL